MRTSCLRGVKCCFVSGKDHTADEKHKRGEISEAVIRLKEKQSTALRTVADLEEVYEMGVSEEDDK